jgi:hypothetical protein
MAKGVRPRRGKTIYLVLDNASWHKTKKLNFLVSYRAALLASLQPGLQSYRASLAAPQKQLPAGFITNKAEILSDKICQSIQVLLDAPKTLKSVCNIFSE